VGNLAVGNGIFNEMTKKGKFRNLAG